MTLTAFSPLTRPHDYALDQSLPRPAIFDNQVKKIGEKYGKTAVQVVLRFLIQLEVIPIPKPSNQSEAIENIEIFDFKLTKEEMEIMEALNTGQRSFPLEFCKNHQYFMFNP